MNYYIQGDAAKADQIKAAFEELGYNTRGLNFSDGFFYTVERDVHYCIYDYMVNFIKTHPDYKELELPIKPKFNVGEWLVYNNGNCFAGGFSEVQVVKVKDGVYYFASGTTGSFKFIDDRCRLWTIADAKNGDVLVMDKTPINHESIFIFQKINEASVIHYCYYFNNNGEEVFGKRISNNIIGHTNQSFHPATKEERDLLFQKMKETGYKWDEVKKELREINSHYDISNFYPGMPVLVRADNNCRWDYSVFSRITGNECWQFAVCNGVSFTQCIPFEGNEHLLGTTDMCDEMYINW